MQNKDQDAFHNPEQWKKTRVKTKPIYLAPVKTLQVSQISLGNQ